jgi:CTP:molybdopterin cytidylyltransferase MocA
MEEVTPVHKLDLFKTAAGLALVLLLSGSSWGPALEVLAGVAPVTVEIYPEPAAGGYRLVVAIQNQSRYPVTVRLAGDRPRVAVIEHGTVVWEQNEDPNAAYTLFTLEPGQERRYKYFWPRPVAAAGAQVVATVALAGAHGLRQLLTSSASL